MLGAIFKNAEEGRDKTLFLERVTYPPKRI